MTGKAQQQHDGDEALARALQKEYDNEHQQPPRSLRDKHATSPDKHHHHQHHGRHHHHRRHKGEEEAGLVVLAPEHNHNYKTAPSTTVTTTHSANNSSHGAAVPPEDKLQQEKSDEELARQWVAEEEAEAQAAALASAVATLNTEPTSSFDTSHYEPHAEQMAYEKQQQQEKEAASTMGATEAAVVAATAATPEDGSTVFFQAEESLSPDDKDAMAAAALAAQEHHSLEEHNKVLQQEQWDQEMALRLQAHEERKAAVAAFKQRTETAPPHHPRPGLSRRASVRDSFYKYSSYVIPIDEQGKCTRPQRRHFIAAIIMLLIAFGGAFGLIYHFVILGNDANQLLEAVQDITGTGIDEVEFVEQDPFFGSNTTHPWEQAPSQQGKGLPMTVLNALEEKWYPFFYKAIRDWDDGTDALDLTTEVVDREPNGNCTGVPGQVKVCNGNYGAVGWRGILSFSTINGFTIVATARMNENYTGNPDTDQAEMQYVMCHELGHAWGLPHSDEDFDNVDLNDCMENTRTPESSQLPGPANFDVLTELYGPDPAIQTEASGNNNRGLRHGSPAIANKDNNVASATTTSAQQQQDRLKREAEVYEDTSGRLLQPEAWRLLHRNEKAEAHAIELLPDGQHTLYVHKLLST